MRSILGKRQTAIMHQSNHPAQLALRRRNVPRHTCCSSTHFLTTTFGGKASHVRRTLAVWALDPTPLHQAQQRSVRNNIQWARSIWDLSIGINNYEFHGMWLGIRPSRTCQLRLANFAIVGDQSAMPVTTSQLRHIVPLEFSILLATFLMYGYVYWCIYVFWIHVFIYACIWLFLYTGIHVCMYLSVMLF